MLSGLRPPLRLREASRDGASPAAHRFELCYRDPMDRDMLERHLEQAEAHVSESERHIAQQRELVAQLERDGLDTTLAKDFLAQLENTHQLHISDLDRIRRELEK